MKLTTSRLKQIIREEINEIWAIPGSTHAKKQIVEAAYNTQDLALDVWTQFGNLGSLIVSLKKTDPERFKQLRDAHSLLRAFIDEIIHPK